ncbi:EamA family transporter RarD [Methylobacterium aerolatum]|uniref:Chloramphenicol-sensitive protein RarD n=1 Tax=Methylobacterium aerolatum TaxID=418708 RepID=A0ABU0I5H1_9HYPH|nr:EamA family transporter RarD [Methylobacterium aerolatum]MDQ0449337.1 chloramphenicol-sensitive protein RarD [Methylobacterium aerolatum]GJD36714.1 Protein RarD [Methylobacterium aerolatum]
MGLVYALAAYLSWGLVVPVHFRLLGGFSPSHILAERIVWSALFAGLLALAWHKRLRLPHPLTKRHALLAVSAALIGLNWLLYLVSIDRGHMLDASLGYYINPLVNVGLGRLVLGERLRPVQGVAIAIAAVGVGIAVIWAGDLPLVSLALAVSFALYSLIRKVVAVDSLVGFLAETLVLLPLAVGWLVVSPQPFLPAAPRDLLLLMLTGVTTAFPLIWFAAAAARLRLTTLGLLQYVAPTGLLLLSVLAYGEQLEPHRVAMFVLIWAGLALYTIDALRSRRPAPGVRTA